MRWFEALPERTQGRLFLALMASLVLIGACVGDPGVIELR